jgi:hypothetical protein
VREGGVKTAELAVGSGGATSGRRAELAHLEGGGGREKGIGLEHSWRTWGWRGAGVRARRRRQEWWETEGDGAVEWWQGRRSGGDAQLPC